MYDSPACGTVDPELFFPRHPRSQEAMAAKAVCGYCPHRLECLDDNLRVPDGIFGALDHNERRRLRYRLGITAENMSPLPNDRAILAQRARREREALAATKAA